MTSALLIAVGGPNLDTFTNVLWALNRRLSGQLSIEKVLVLEVGDPRTDLGELARRIGTALGREAELRVRRLDRDLQTMIPESLVAGAREVGRAGLVVDLTTGTKAVSAILYACGSFSQLEHLYYVNVHKKGPAFPQLWAEAETERSYELVALAPLRDVRELASQSYFDLVFYVEHLAAVEDRAPLDVRDEVHRATNQLRVALPLFFRNPPDYLSAMRAIGTAGEELVGLILKTVERLEPAKAPVDGRKLGQWSDEFRERARKGGPATAMSAIPGALVLDTAARTLQHWRNAAAHKHPPRFSLFEVRTAMHTCIELLQTALAMWATL
jgi:hypothetical protein